MRFFSLVIFLLLASAPLCAQDIHVHVDPHGPGSADSKTDYTSVQQALDHAPQPAAPYRLWIEIAPGTYHERIRITRNRPRVTLLGLGEDPADTVITASQNAKSAGGTFFSATTDVEGDGFEADNLTFANTAGATGQAVAIVVRSDKAVFKRCRFLGYQDTLFADYGRQYYVDSYIEGAVDFIFGNAAAVFNHDEIHIVRPGYLTAQSRIMTDQPTGYVILNSRITSAIEPCAPGTECEGRHTFFLGRPWRPYSRVVYIHDELPATLDPAGWSLWRSTDPVPPLAFYAEYDNSGPGADLSHRPSWVHQLTAQQAAAFEPRTFLRGDDHWNPIAAAAALPGKP